MAEIPDPLFRQRAAVALYVSALAHPTDQRRAGALYNAMAAHYWRSLHHETRSWHGQEWARGVRLRALRESGPISAGWRLIAERRFPAALAAEALYHGAARNVQHALSDEILGTACQQHGITIISEENRARRIWRESRPALHLALALHAALEAADRPEQIWDPDALMERPQWVLSALSAARAFVPKLLAPPFGLKPAAIQLVDQLQKIAKI
ncbi:MAG: hypothetical protein KIS79_12445 [Burkholderiales bacterium]|nr:hypothetical protein [Burkholderiales bacterium]